MKYARFFSTSLICLLLITCVQAAAADKKAGTEPCRPVKEIRSSALSPSLSENDKKTLFLIARDTLTWCAKGRKKTFSFTNYQTTTVLMEKKPVYISIEIDDKKTLQSGELSFKKPIYKAVHDHTQRAIIDKNKFSKITTSEVAKAKIKITLTSTLKGVQSLNSFRFGEHGLYLQKKPHSATLLPDELAQRGDNIQTILNNLSIKSKRPLHKGFWNRGARYYTFTTTTLSQ
ncbi:MAG: AMMECR1 domain-containing protein [Kiritimatiellae bacterium]|nr:AMMECR1 domain-containing protein [Kiritimatiellia bacterium]